MIYFFLMLTFFISWGGWFFMPPAYGDLIMFVPGFIAVVLTIYKREKLKKLFHFGEDVTVSV